MASLSGKPASINKHFQKMLAGDDNSTEIIARIVRQFVKKYLQQNLYHVSVEDVVQDIFLLFFTKRQFDPKKSNAMTFIGLVCKFHTIDLLRKFYRQSAYVRKAGQEKMLNNVYSVTEQICVREQSQLAKACIFEELNNSLDGAYAYIMLQIARSTTIKSMAISCDLNITTVKTQSLRFRRKCVTKYDKIFN